MKNYTFYVQNSNGTESKFRERVLSDDSEADKLLAELNDSGFDYRYEVGEEVDEDEFSDSVENDEVIEEDADEDTDENEDVVVEEEELDVEWEDNADADEFPQGWHRRTEFVAKDGTVYMKGEEQPDLKRTLEPSDY